MPETVERSALIKKEDYLFEIPKSYRADMRVPAYIFINEKMLASALEDRALWQTVNVATLPGIVHAAMAMPDIHQGYGFPIGGVAAMDINHGGVISPGGIGYDINCGVRLLTANISRTDIKPFLEQLATAIFHAVPSGVGRGGKLKVTEKQLDKILQGGARYMVEWGYGLPQDIAFCEEQGCMSNANPALISTQAKERGHDQLGTLGSGNHFLEVQYVDEIFDEQAAQAFGLHKEMVTVMIHCGSRGLGHQTCTDYVRSFMPKLAQWGIELPDRELVCAPFQSQEGQDYFNAMAAAANFAWANRHLIAHEVRAAWQSILGKEHSLKLIYDVSHNIGKVEQHTIDGRQYTVIIHRKGATRAFGPDRPEIPAQYRSAGQPVLIPGTMGTSSFVLAGTAKGMQVSLGSSCHGAGRRMSRIRAKKEVRGSSLRQQLEKEGIVIRAESDVGLAEEAPIAYKDVDNVVEVVRSAGIANKVARLRPLAVIKGD